MLHHTVSLVCFQQPRLPIGTIFLGLLHIHESPSLPDPNIWHKQFVGYPLYIMMRAGNTCCGDTKLHLEKKMVCEMRHLSLLFHKYQPRVQNGFIHVA